MKKRFFAIFTVILMLLSQIKIFANGSHIESTNINNESAEAMEMNNSFCCSSFSNATKESLRLRDNGDSLNATTTNTVVFELNSEQQVVELNCESDGLTVVSNNYQNGLVYVTFTYNDNVVAPMLTVAVLLEDDTILTANMYGYYFEGQLFVSGASTDDAFEKYCLFLLNIEAIDENQYKSIRNTYYKQSVSITTSTELAMQTIVAPGTAETQAASKTTYVKGYITWNDDRGIEHPCQYVKVNVYDKEAWNPQLLATTYTNVGGFYSVTFENEDIIWELGCDLYIEVFAEGETVSVKNTSGVAYSISTVDEVINNVGNGTTSTISIKFEMIDDGYFVGGDLAKAMQVSQPAIVASRYAKVMNNSQALDPVEVYYPVADGSWYASGTKRIYLSGDSAEYPGTPNAYASWDVIMHEYGHHVQNVIGNISDNPGGTHYVNANMADHYYEVFYNIRLCQDCQDDGLEIDSLDYCRNRALKLSWAEAWATVFGFMAQEYYINSLQNIEFIGNARYDAYNIGSLNGINLETYVDDAPGETNETSIITILYNLYDSNNNDFDNISLGHQGFWNAIVNSESSVLSDFTSYLLGTNIVNEDDLSNLLDYQEVNAKPLHNPGCYTTFLPTFHWEARGGSYYFENNAFNLIFYNIYGDEVLETPRVTDTQYKLTENEWQTILSNCGDQFQWAVIAYQTDGMETGPYRSMKSETVTVSTIPLNLDVAVQGSVEEPSGYDWYKFTPTSSGTYTFYTTGTTDTYADVFNRMAYGLRTDNMMICDDDSGDSTNFKISYWLSEGCTIYIRVRAFSTEIGEYTLYAHKES